MFLITLYILYILYIYIYIYILVAETVKNLSAVDLGLISELGRPPGEGNGNPLQYSYLENYVDRESQWATVYGFSVRHKKVTNTHL